MADMLVPLGDPSSALAPLDAPLPLDLDPRKLGCRCDECPLGKLHRRDGSFRPVLPEIHGGEEMVILGEAPGEEEVEHRRPFVGRSGRELTLWMDTMGIARTQVVLDNALLCRPPGNNLERLLAEVQRERAATVKANQQRRRQGLPVLPLPISPLDACRPHVVRTLLRFPYAFVVGSKAYQTIRGGARPMRRIRGAFQELVAIAEDGDHSYGALRFIEESTLPPGAEIPIYGRLRLVPTFHPAFVLRKLSARMLTLRDLNRLVRWRAGKLDWPETVRVERNPSPARLRDYLYGPNAALHHGIDVETRGIDPLGDLDLRTLAIADRDGGVVIHFRSVDGHTFLGDEAGVPDDPRPIVWQQPDLDEALDLLDAQQPSINPVTGLVVQRVGWRVGDPALPVPKTALPFRGWYSPAEAREIRSIIIQYLSDPRKQKIGHNWNYFDEEVIQQKLGVATWTWQSLDLYPLDYQGLIPGMVWDTICGTRGDHSELPRDLYTLGTRMTDVPAWKESNDEKVATATRSDGDLATYNVIDSMVTDRSGVRLLSSIRARGLGAVMNLDFRMQHIMRETRRLGMCIDETARLEKEHELFAARQLHRAAVRDIVGDSNFNPQSINQMEELFFKTLALPPLAYSDKTGRPTLDDGTLRAYRRMAGIPVEYVTLIDSLRRFRKVSKELATFVLPLRLATDLRPNAKGEMVGGLTFPPLRGHRHGRVHPHYSVHGPGTGRRSSSGPNCFLGDTEVLTDRGWVRFDALLAEHAAGQSHRLAQWAAGEITFAAPTAYHDHPYTGDLIAYTSQSASLVTTPNHDVLVATRGGRVRKVEARDLNRLRGTDNYTLHSGTYAGGPGLAWTLDELRWLVAMQADGSWHTAGTGADFAFVKPRKADRLRDLLGRLGWAYHEGRGSNGRYRFYIPHNPATRRAHTLLGSDKLWGPWLLEATRAQLDAILDEVWHWDAMTECRSQYGSKHATNADWIQTLLVLSGSRANQRTFTNQRGRSIQMVDVRHGATTNAMTLKSTWEVQPTGPTRVYCVTMPQGTIVVRHQGRVTITGQSHNIPKHLRALFVPDEGNVFIGADYDQIELRLISGIAGVKAYLIVFREGGDPHATTAFLIYGQTFEDALKESLTPEQWAQYKRTGSPPKADHGSPMYESLRRFAKTFVYAVIYGGTASTIFASVSAAEDPKTGELLFPTMTRTDVQIAYDSWMANAPEVPRWWAEIERFCRVNGYVREPIMGRIRDFPEYSPTEVPNMPIQGGAAIIMARGLCRLRDRVHPDFFNFRGIVSEVHDAVTVECADNPAEIRRTQMMIEEALTQSFDSIPGVTFTTKASKPVYTWKET